MKQIVSALLANLLVFTLSAVEPATKPNIVIILTDDQGYADVGKFGAEGFQTPNLDRMADEGAIFRNFHVAQPVCSASRAALLTGCYPNRIGIHGALGPHSKIGLSDDEMTLGATAQAARLRDRHVRQMASGRLAAVHAACAMASMNFSACRFPPTTGRAIRT